ncbi:ketoacyl-ACP synthase III family protein [Fodinicola feengrottensis]|uniref:Ketoacyl-ACP synthase III family protein n=1 Tax=Fodinicola feengrottensis TaxID=435914 RepID=A0ABP4SP74_9ACTN
MRYESLFVAGVGGWLPPAVNVAEAIADGRYPADAAVANDYAEITVADQDSPPEMAVRAGRLALERAGVGPEEVAVLLHASSWYQGIDFWPPASYIHRELLGNAGRYAPALDVQQMSNGVAVLELAANYVAAGSERPAALVTCADRFQPPGFDRWGADTRNMVWGDGAAAIVLSRTGGFARLLAAATVSDTVVEGLNRAGEPFGTEPGHAGWPIDLRSRRRAYKEQGQLAGKENLSVDGLTDAVERTLDEAGRKLSDVTRVVFPNVSLATITDYYLAPLGLELPVTTWEWGRRTGHIGTADQFLGLADLLENDQVNAGDQVLLVGIGIGMAWSCAVLEILERPDWTPQR